MTNLGRLLHKRRAAYFFQKPGAWFSLRDVHRKSLVLLVVAAPTPIWVD